MHRVARDSRILVLCRGLQVNSCPFLRQRTLKRRQNRCGTLPVLAINYTEGLLCEFQRLGSFSSDEWYPVVYTANGLFAGSDIMRSVPAPVRSTYLGCRMQREQIPPVYAAAMRLLFLQYCPLRAPEAFGDPSLGDLRIDPIGQPLSMSR